LTTLTVGIFALSAAIIYLGPPRLGWLLRPIYIIGGFLLVDPGIITDVIGFALLSCAFVMSFTAKKKEKTV
jgi:UPF0716 family protein affecting phage T7 exclusion